MQNPSLDRLTPKLLTQSAPEAQPGFAPALRSDSGSGAGSWLRRHRGGAAIGAAAAVGLAVVISSQLTSKGDSLPLSVHNAGPAGARAVSEILGRHGVEVQDVGSFDAATTALADRPGATLLLYDRSGFLDQFRLEQLTAGAGRVVLVTPRLSTLKALDTGISQAGVVPESTALLAPGCDLSDPAAAGAVSGTGGFLYDGGTVCFSPPGSSAGLLVRTDDGGLTVLGSTALLNNGGLADPGHAALALRTLGSSEDLVWYLPGLGDAAAAESTQTLDDLAPGWVAFLGPWLVFVAVLAVVWRGRRLGPLVFEPLPVVVKAVETAEGRARLYQDSHALDRARDNLRAGTLVRLAHALRVGSEATADDVVQAAARHLGRPVTDINGVIQESPGTAARLVQWSQELDKLENEVRTR
ncbi:DUF4350 domain-containing protein [Pseudarthrobacter sp. AL07]|uniref:DUF4350 domain-containing protein n=1 Tax=unclassified Pseudarthrobacter TaxID=2647000 RepID=UPI00249A728F|nr:MULTISPECIES: DUF4350 domain-containing protein [unclassified Pseudarthrobacter]MDI3193105.1 DUF4350 domain-containing protein [Pseudarthrobacter sp. AL20]MDI3207075.1 DUF4350 domain-containing protein [Pseudarthrobacter sp. AL07]